MAIREKVFTISELGVDEEELDSATDIFPRRNIL
jgi:hypothetical protein